MPFFLVVVNRQLSPFELAHHESLIEEREEEIREIETGIHELSEIFRDLGTLVTEQGGMLGKSYTSHLYAAHTHLFELKLSHAAYASQTISSRTSQISPSTPPARQKSSTLHPITSGRRDEERPA